MSATSSKVSGPAFGTSAITNSCSASTPSMLLTVRVVIDSLFSLSVIVALGIEMLFASIKPAISL